MAYNENQKAVLAELKEIMDFDFVARLERLYLSKNEEDRKIIKYNANRILNSALKYKK